jgi:hypothetical protein
MTCFLSSQDAFVSALELAYNFERWSRTRSAAQVRILCAVHILTGGEPGIATIARRCKVSRRRVSKALREVRPHAESSLPIQRES